MAGRRKIACARMTTYHLLRLRGVCEITGLSRSTIYRLIDAGDFPRSVVLGEHSVAWVAAEVEAWIAARIEARDQEAA